MEPQHLTANAVEFAYLEEGEGPLVVLIHGFPDTADSWLPTLDMLAEAGFHAVAPWTRLPPDGDSRRRQVRRRHPRPRRAGVDRRARR